MGRLDGRCLCGAVTYSSDAEPLFAAVCHCKNCQRQSGTAFSVVVAVPEPDFAISGELGEITTTGEDHGLPTHRLYCAACGSPMFTRSEALPGVAIIKAGTLDDTSWVQPQLEIWGSSAQAWVPEVEGRPRLPGGPPPP